MPHARATVAALWSLTLSRGGSLPAIGGLNALSAAPGNWSKPHGTPRPNRVSTWPAHTKREW